MGEWHTRSRGDRKEAQRNEGKWESLVEKLAQNLVFWQDREFREIVFGQRVACLIFRALQDNPNP